MNRRILLCVVLALAAVVCGTTGCANEAETTLRLGDGMTMKLVLIPAGKFLMGSGVSAEQLARQSKGIGPEWFAVELPQREVTITKPFCMGVTEVTQSQWRAVMGTEPWESGVFAGKDGYVKEGGENAASYVSWDEATAFCKKLTQRTGRAIRLPTEAEWEYACRAGSKTKFCFGDDDSKLGGYAWCDKNAWGIGEKYAHPVGRKKPNAWGLYDMHGNVYEWCGDWYGEKYYSATGNTVDPTGPASGSSRVLRGGSFVVTDGGCRSAHRWKDSPSYEYSFDRGFRVALSPVAPTPTK